MLIERLAFRGLCKSLQKTSLAKQARQCSVKLPTPSLLGINNGVTATKWTSQVVVKAPSPAAPDISYCSLRTLHTSFITMKRDNDGSKSGSVFGNLTPDSEVILINNKEKMETMKYSDILEKAGDRHLVHVQLSKKEKDQVPRFKIMSDVDLEIAVRKGKQKRIQKPMGSNVILETKDAGRVKQKELDISTAITEHHLQLQTTKIRKWLEKGYFVKISVKEVKGGTKKDVSRIQEQIKDSFSDNVELLGLNSAKLVFK